MMANPAAGEAQLSPLDQVRLAEANVTRKVAAALKNREHSLTKTKAQAKLLLDEARQRGEREGQIQYREIVSEAEEKARAVRAGANHEAEELRLRGSRKMGVAVRRVVNIITGIEEDEAGE